MITLEEHMTRCTKVAEAIGAASIADAQDILCRVFTAYTATHVVHYPEFDITKAEDMKEYFKEEFLDCFNHHMSYFVQDMTNRYQEKINAN